jgi:thiamine biosynthesis protein ThiS
MKVFLNGEEIETSAKTIDELLLERKIEKSKIALDVNAYLVTRSEYSTFPINEGDRIEIIAFVGGG